MSARFLPPDSGCFEVAHLRSDFAFYLIKNARKLGIAMRFNNRATRQ